MKIIVSDNPVLLRCVSFEKSARHECSIEVVLTEGEDRMWERLSAEQIDFARSHFGPRASSHPLKLC